MQHDTWLTAEKRESGTIVNICFQLGQNHKTEAGCGFPREKIIYQHVRCQVDGFSSTVAMTMADNLT